MCQCAILHIYNCIHAHHERESSESHLLSRIFIEFYYSFFPLLFTLHQRSIIIICNFHIVHIAAHIFHSLKKKKIIFLVFSWRVRTRSPHSTHTHSHSPFQQQKSSRRLSVIENGILFYYVFVFITSLNCIANCDTIKCIYARVNTLCTYISLSIFIVLTYFFLFFLVFYFILIA